MEALEERSYHFGPWSVLSYSNLATTSHTSDLNLDRAKLVYGLVMKMNMNLGSLISGQISLVAQSNSSRLEFPGGWGLNFPTLSGRRWLGTIMLSH